MVPIVPIEPDFHEGMHHMWKAYGGFTWAFKDYFFEETVLNRLDSDLWRETGDILLDPLNYPERMKEVPKLVIVSSDDEFMMFEWTSLWWDRMEGEKYLLIAPDTKHSTTTNLETTLNAVAWFVNKIKTNSTENRQFTSSFNEESGEVEVQMDEDATEPLEVMLRYVETISTTMRDFRWIVPPNQEGECLPPLKESRRKGFCWQPLLWEAEKS